MDAPHEPWEAIVIGGGVAGLSAALVLARARRRVLVVDAGQQSNLPAHGIGGLLGQNERPPAELYDAGRKEILAHPSAEVQAASAIDAGHDDAAAVPFTVALSDGTEHAARTVLLATGMHYAYPAVEGFATRWGRTVFHCPFCHGWEVRGRPLGVLGSGAGAVHRALLLRGWTDDVTVYASAAIDEGAVGGPQLGAPLTGEEEARLTAAGVQVEHTPLIAAEGDGEALSHVRLADGTSRACGGLLVPTVLRQRSQLASQLGTQLAEPGPVVADGVVVDAMQATTVPGLYAAGDASTQMPQITTAISTGMMAGAAMVGRLMDV